MAIAFDANGSIDGSSGTTATWSHTCTGSDRILIVASFQNSDDTITQTATYNGVAMTATSNSPQKISGSEDTVYLFYLINPASGANNVVVTSSSSVSIRGRSSSYTGASQTVQPDAVGQNSSASATSLTTTVTTVANNSWVVGAGRDNVDSTSAGSGTTQRNTGSNSVFAIYDSGGAVNPAGNKDLIFTSPTSGGMVMVAMSITAAGEEPAVNNSNFFQLF